MAEAGAAAAASLVHLTGRSWPEEPLLEPVRDVDKPRVGVFVCHCGSNIAGVVDVPQVVEFARTLPDVVWAQDQMFSCAGVPQQEIAQAIREKGINRVVVAACSPNTHEGTFRGVLVRAGLNPYLLEMVNLRNQDSWVHKGSREEATEKAKDMVRMGGGKGAPASAPGAPHPARGAARPGDRGRDCGHGRGRQPGPSGVRDAPGGARAGTGRHPAPS
ncbi:MAG: hypothetical protein N0A24_00525 [Armatimonadetes bacterium]|nr:hypothetical protein [Armatimonadota bacterium]MDW8152708.1 hypothetical protein [Armatimonadota bacterium]